LSSAIQIRTIRHKTVRVFKIDFTTIKCCFPYSGNFIRSIPISFRPDKVCKKRRRQTTTESVIKTERGGERRTYVKHGKELSLGTSGDNEPVSLSFPNGFRTDERDVPGTGPARTHLAAWSRVQPVAELIRALVRAVRVSRCTRITHNAACAIKHMTMMTLSSDKLCVCVRARGRRSCWILLTFSYWRPRVYASGGVFAFSLFNIYRYVRMSRTYVIHRTLVEWNGVFCFCVSFYFICWFFFSFFFWNVWEKIEFLWYFF